MNESIQNKLTRMIMGMNKSRLGGSADAISSLLSSPEGKKLVSSLSESDKQAIIQRFLSLNEQEVKEKLKNFDPKSLSGLSADDILKKLR